MTKTQILIVEDEAIVAEDIRRSLQSLGYDVLSIASSGEEAILKVRKNKPDLVLMDIVLQGEMSGIDAAKLIGSEFDIPVVYLTAYSDKNTLERAKITEPYGYLIKPFKEVELSITVEIAFFKHRMEKKLKESKEWFTTTLESIDDGVIATDSKGCVRFMNLVAQSLTEWELAEAKGKPLGRVFDILFEPSEDIEGNQTVLITKNKTKIPIDFSNAFIRDNKGIAAGNVIVFRDTSDRKRALEALTQSNKFNETVLNSIMLPISIINVRDYRILEVNRFFLDAYGLKKEMVTGRTCYEIIRKKTSPCTPPQDTCPLADTLKTGKPASSEHVYSLADGRKQYTEVNTWPIKNENGEITQVVYVSNDITERKLAGEALLGHMEKYRSIVEHSSDMIWTLDKQGNFTYFNKKAEEISGYNMAEWLGKSFTPMTHPDESPRIQNIFLGALAGKSQQYEVNIYKKDGQILILSVSIAPLFESGKVVGTINIGRDITEYKKAEEMRVEKRSHMLLNKAKVEFLTILNRELLAPLIPIIESSAILKQGEPGVLNEKQTRYLDDVILNSKHLFNLIDDILDLARLDSGKIELSIGKVSVPEIINELLLHEKQANPNLKLKIDADPQLEFIEADRQRLRQVLFNLLSNAVKFSKEEGGTVTITTKKEGDMAKISVSDTGIGIKEEDMEKLFKEFEQLDSGSTKKYGGIGLGLAISKKLVELHGGRILAESEYGKGSTFTVLLPVTAKGQAR